MGDGENTWIAIFICLAGCFSLLGSIFNWGFFFESRKAELFLKLLGRKGARIFYALLGMVLIFMGYNLINS
jgi:small neutral amino acid transporter SnatA (MarC family)